MKQIIDILYSNNKFYDWKRALQNINLTYKVNNRRETFGLVTKYEDFVKWLEHDLAYIYSWTSAIFVRKYVNTCILILRTFNITPKFFNNLPKQIFAIDRYEIRNMYRFLSDERIRFDIEKIKAKYDDTLYDLIVKSGTQSKIIYLLKNYFSLARK